VTSVSPEPNTLETRATLASGVVDMRINP
jgi:hypothetical protein